MAKLLSQLKKNAVCIMTGVVDHSPAFLQYLDKINILLGNEIKVDNKTAYDGSLSISVNKKNKIYISNQVAQNILVLVK